MSHYTRDYSQLPAADKADKAIQDIKEWLGDERFKLITEEFRKVDKLSEDQFGFYVALAGVSGYPVQAWYEFTYNLKELS